MPAMPHPGGWIGAQLQHGAVGNGAYAKIETDGVDFFIKEAEGITLHVK